MRHPTRAAFLLLATLAVASPLDQLVLSPGLSEKTALEVRPSTGSSHNVHSSIVSALNEHPDDPVAALIAFDPAYAAELAKPRLLEVKGDGPARWMTEGDKLRLRREGNKFIDFTDRQDAVDRYQAEAFVGHAHLPNITHQNWVLPSFKDISTEKMHDNLKHLTSYYSRYYHSFTGEQSARWIHDHVAEIISASPFRTYISLEYHTHSIAQPSIIARFDPPVKNASLPYTILGAHQDSANYLFPLLPAPGADDDCSGTVAILEAFRVLATRGFVPENGPVEFHWYAGEEAGNLGSLPVAGYKKDIGAKVGAMLEFDMVAWIAKNATESITLVKTEADMPLTNWVAKLSKEYIDLPIKIRELGRGGSDYMSFSNFGFPAAFATEGDMENGEFPGEFDPYVHGVNDRMDLDDENGVFSLDHMARFAELAIAFAVEQGGWSLKHTREEDKNGLWNAPVVA
nr:uncharacterized protein CI109_005641 [Kwoniella shandongensis]KAA5526045.1 hypothetical protein CI109_005641 [Kwoniella shandongensis]